MMTKRNAKKKQSTFSFGESTLDYKHFLLVSGENKTKPNRRTRDKRLTSHPMDLSHLGFNAGDEVYITEDVVKELETEYKTDYHNSFCSDGFFWGQQFQEECCERI